MHLPSFTRIDRNARRLTEILSILAKYGLADCLGGLHLEWLRGQLVSFDGERLGKVSHEARIRLALIELGTTFVKLGQVLSTRRDLVGPELARELGQLRSNTPPDPPQTVRATIQSELGRPIEELFSEFEAEAFASASIGQVHRARLPGGQAVVVKVQHAGIEDKIASDLEMMAYLAGFLEKHVSGFRAYQPTAVVREFRRTILKELDFSCERRNLGEFARRFADDPTVHFPVTYPECCTRRVLTMERLDGIRVEDYEGLHGAGVDLDEVARHGANIYLEMIFRDGFYHADPHPGNLILLPNGVIGIIDGGMIGRIDEHLREEIEDLVVAVVHQDSQELSTIVMRLGSAPPGLDAAALGADLNDFCLEYGTRSLRDLNLGEALNEMTDIIRRYHIVLPPSCSLLLKTLIMLEGTSRQLNPTFSLAEMIQPYEEKSLKRRFSLKRWWGRLSQTYRDWDRLLEALPRDLAEILRRVRGGDFEVHLEHHRLEATVNRLVAGLLTAALLLGSAELWSRDVPPTLHGISIPGVLGYVIALLLGYRLLRQIHRAGR